MRSKLRYVGALWALSLLTVSISADAATASDVARALRVRITDTFKCENLQVSVVPYADQNLTNQGRFHSNTVRADSASRSGIAMKPLYIVVDMSKLFAADPKVDTKSRGKTQLHIEINEEDLTEGLRQAQDVIPDLAASLNGGQITLTGTYRMLVGNKFKMAGKLKVVDGAKINFVPTAVKVNGIPVPVSGVKVVLAKINPLLDLSTVVMKPRIASMVVENGKLVAR